MKKYSFWVKCVTFVLCVVLALCVAVSGLGVLMAASMEMYNHSAYDAWMTDNYYQIADVIADHIIQRYGAEQSESPQWLLEQTGHAHYAYENVGDWFDLADNEWYYIIKDARGRTLEATSTPNIKEALKFTFENLSFEYPVIVDRQPRVISGPDTEPTYAADETSLESGEIVPDVTAVTDVPIEYIASYWDPYTGEEVFVDFQSEGGYQVTVGISKNYMGYRNYSGLPSELVEWLFAARFALIAIIAVSFCLFAVAFVFLMIIAGRDSRTGEANPKALNKLPLDLYLAAGVCGTVLGCIGAYELLDLLFYEKSNYNMMILVLLCGCGIGVATLDMGFFMAMAAQFKVPGRYWFKNSICGRVLRFCWKYCRLAGSSLVKVFRMLPIIWQWIAAGGVLGIILLIICAGSASHWYSIFPLFVWCLAFAALVIYCGCSYGVISKGIRRMKNGDLNETIKTDWLFGSFKSIAEDLNDLSDVVSVAAEKQLKSERMKTELITNVSHDIKTPLTSVINYVDLLQQPHTEEEGEQYLEVLSRQSIRLKKLVEDLMDMSKASSGNMAVNITDLDAVEAVNQALGEFADKLDAAQLTPMFRSPDSQLHMLADGRLTWRVLSNLLSNVVKYALPGTRVYIDLLRLDKSVVLSVKNISREELNISAEELTERFVRGDDSRNTEGSGLGLNIAQSLMQLQRGNLELTVDGDLFKVTLTFPTE